MFKRKLGVAMFPDCTDGREVVLTRHSPPVARNVEDGLLLALDSVREGIGGVVSLDIL